MNGTVAEHTVQTCQRLVESSMSVARAVEDGRTAIVGLTYSLAEGTANEVKVIGNLAPAERPASRRRQAAGTPHARPASAGEARLWRPHAPRGRSTARTPSPRPHTNRSIVAAISVLPT